MAELVSLCIPPAPEEFVARVEGEDFEVTMRPTKPGCLLALLGVVLLGLAPAVVLVPVVFLGALLEGRWFLAAFTLVCGAGGAVAYLVFARMFLHRAFGHSSFCLRSGVFQAQHGVFWFRWGDSIPRGCITGVCQVHIPATHDNSFEGWGVRIETKRNLDLLNHESHECARWLSEFLAYRLQVALRYVTES